ncbi:MAG: hypothetical protein HY204_02290, partial [Nitrospirae bacterium]|nr:hypothetical protein [Nitrospirota bacterium]
MVRRIQLLGMGLFMLWMAGSSGTAFAYREIDVLDGGSITGKVILKGSIPEPRVFPVVQYPFGVFCKKVSDGQGNIHLEEFIVSPGGGMQDT